MEKHKDTPTIKLKIEESGDEIDMRAPPTFEGFLKELLHILDHVPIQEIPKLYKLMYLNRNEDQISFVSESSYVTALQYATA